MDDIMTAQVFGSFKKAQKFSYIVGVKDCLIIFYTANILDPVFTGAYLNINEGHVLDHLKQGSMNIILKITFLMNFPIGSGYKGLFSVLLFE